MSHDRIPKCPRIASRNVPRSHPKMYRDHIPHTTLFIFIAICMSTVAQVVLQRYILPRKGRALTARQLYLHFYSHWRGRMDYFVIFRIFKSILFFVNFIVLFPFLIKYYHILFIILFSLGSDRLSGLLSFVPSLLFSILTPLFCPSSSVPLSYFSLAVPMRECLEKHSCISSQFPIAILNCTSSFLSLVQENINMPADTIIGFVPEVAVKNNLIKKNYRHCLWLAVVDCNWQLPGGIL